MGKHSTKNMIPICEPREFTFKGYSTLVTPLTDEQIIELGLRKYCIKISKVKPSQLVVKGTMIIEPEQQVKWLRVLCFPVELNEHNEITFPIRPPLTILPGIADFKTPSDTFNFTSVNYNDEPSFECNALFFYARPVDHDVTILFSCFKKE